jgi:hypothetical protein
MQPGAGRAAAASGWTVRCAREGPLACLPCTTADSRLRKVFPGERSNIFAIHKLLSRHMSASGVRLPLRSVCLLLRLRMLREVRRVFCTSLPALRAPVTRRKTWNRSRGGPPSAEL